jgi:ferredoxin
MKIDRARGMVLVRGLGTGGTTTLASGNAVRMDEGLREIGVNLDAEFAELEAEIPISTSHRTRWNKVTRLLWETCVSAGLDPEPMPKMIRAERCVACGRCVLGCRYGAKWDSREFLTRAVERGARLQTGVRAARLEIDGRKAGGIWVRGGGRRRLVTADLIVLAAGGLGTPAILASSGIAAAPRLFVDPVLCVAAEWPAAFGNREIPMPFFIRKRGYMVSPYFDFLSYFFNCAWRPAAPNILSLMIKLADEPSGSVGRGGVDKSLTELDKARLEEAVDFCASIFSRLGVSGDRLFLGTINAGHPGGTTPLDAASARTLHPGLLPDNVFVADASLVPASPGGPPILTIMALARKTARLAAASVSG